MSRIITLQSMNCPGIKSKLSKINCFLMNTMIDVFAIQETWLSPIVGDFTCPSASWTPSYNSTFEIWISDLNSKVSALCDLIAVNGLNQYNGTKNSNDKMLDLMFARGIVSLVRINIWASVSTLNGYQTIRGYVRRRSTINRSSKQESYTRNIELIARTKIVTIGSSLKETYQSFSIKTMRSFWPERSTMAGVIRPTFID